MALEYNSTAVLNGSNFQVDSPTPQSLIDAANAYITAAVANEALGQGEDAYFLNVTPASQLDAQAMISTDMLSFTDVKASNPILTTAASETAGGVVGASYLSDVATLAGGSAPGGTIQFSLTSPDGSTVNIGSPVPVSGDNTYNSPSVLATEVGAYQWHASYSGDGINSPTTDQGGAAEGLTTIKSSPAINTAAQVSSPATVGVATLYDVATLTGGYQPGGTIQFSLTSPDGSTVNVGSAVSVSGDNTYDSISVTATEVGTYEWHAYYSGDTDNGSATDQGGSAEGVTIGQASPAINTAAQVSSPATVGVATLYDVATLTGGYQPGGTIQFSLTSPDGNTVNVGSAVSVSGDNTYDSISVTATEVGTYEWHAYYSGDTDNGSATDQGGSAEGATIAQASPAINTAAQVSSPATVGVATLYDVATLTGGYQPGGTIQFSLTSPDGNTVNVGSAVSVSGDNTYDSISVTATEVGTYEWHAYYSGDTDNGSATDQGGSAEGATIAQASPAINTAAQVSSPATVGVATLYDVATLTGGYQPGGTIQFSLTSPDGNTVNVGSAVSVNGDNTYDSISVTATEVGTYEWHAYYSGDTDNGSASDQGGSAEGVTIAQASPAINTAAQVSSPATVGVATLYDVATLTGGYQPGGTIQFSLTSPDGNTVNVGSAVSVSGDNTYDSISVTATEVGTYEWHAYYSGDTDNGSATDQGGSAEGVTIGQASPAINTAAQVSSPATVGVATLYDVATLTGGYQPGGTIQFSLTSPDGNTVNVGSAVSVSGDNTYDSISVTGTEVGTYEWHAYYSGDTDNGSATDQGGSAEGVTIAQASPAINTAAQVSSPATVGVATLYDVATLTGGYQPGGTIQFSLTSPDGNTVNVGSAVSVSGDNTYDSISVTATEVGTYEWHAYYSGDTDNGSATDQGGSAEGVTIAQASPAINTAAQVSSPATVGVATLYDVATLTGGYQPGGTIQFSLTSPDGNTVNVGSAVSVSGDNTYDSISVTGTEVGTYEWHAYYSGDTDNGSATDQGGSAEGVTTIKACPAINTAAHVSSPATVGVATLYDVATLTGGYQPGGTIQFSLTSPGGTTVNVGSPVSVSGDSTYDSISVLATAVGTYEWHAVYSGDANNNTATDQGGSAEGVTTIKACPAINTAAHVSSPATVGVATLYDVATLTGGYQPGGTIQFSLTSPGGTTVNVGSPVSVSGDSTYDSISVLATAVGTYEWHAVYSGDANNNTATDQGGSAEGVTTIKACPAINTAAHVSSPATVGVATLYDVATLTGGYQPGGTIQFSLTSPGGTTVNVGSPVSVSGDSTYDSISVLATAVGTYEWHAVYSGDANNNTATDQGGSAEGVTTIKACPAINTAAHVSSPATVGVATLYDVATVTGGYQPGGTIQFSLTSPDGSTATVGSPVSVSGDNTYDSISVTATEVGAYQWHAVYSGDADNNGASDQGGSAEGVTTTKACPSIATTASGTANDVVGSSYLSDTAVLTGGYNAAGNISFTLKAPNGSTQTETVTLNGSSSYTTPTPILATQVGTYTWSASYAGNGLNNGAVDNGQNESVCIVSASPTIVTTPNPTVFTVGTSCGPLTDSATLSGGMSPGGSITFTLYAPGSSNPVDTESVTVKGDGTYVTPQGYTLPSNNPKLGALPVGRDVQR